MFKDSIVAVATALHQAALSIIRLSGEDVIEVVNKMVNIDVHKLEANRMTYAYVIDPLTKEYMDEVMVVLYRAPKSFSGEDMIEINCHGGTFITKEIVRLSLYCGARLARPGEFSQRAFINGKMDLTKAEAIHDMVFAMDKNQARMAVQALRGSVQKLVDTLITQLLEIIAHIEVNIDYPEYDDVEMLTSAMVLPMCEALLETMDQIIIQAQSGKVLKDGVKTAIIGKPNVGKSSLLNALLEEDKAIVSEIEGTTRDIVEGSIRLPSITLHLIDTAGIRESEDVIENLGIEKSKKMMDAAAFVIVVFDGSKPLDEKDRLLLEMSAGKDRMLVYNKRDVKEHEGINVSAKQNDIGMLQEALHKKFEQYDGLHQQAMLQNERQLALMSQAQQSLKQAREALLLELELDLVSIDLQAAYYALKEIVGEVSKDDLLDTLFSKFCLGK